MPRPHAISIQSIALVLGGFVVAGTAVGWLIRRFGAVAEPLQPPPTNASALLELPEEPAPSSFSFEPEPASQSHWSAQPAARRPGIVSLDDYEAFDPEELGAAFLAGATDTALDEPPASTEELAGFQVFERANAEDSDKSG
jgi:hypothetical protein